MSIRLASSSFHTIHDMVWQYNNLFKHAVFETFTMEVHIGISWYLLYLSWIVLWCQSRNSWLLWRKKTQRGSGGARLQGDRALLVEFHWFEFTLWWFSASCSFCKYRPHRWFFINAPSFGWFRASDEVTPPKASWICPAWLEQWGKIHGSNSLDLGTEGKIQVETYFIFSTIIFNWWNTFFNRKPIETYFKKR